MIRWLLSLVVLVVMVLVGFRVLKSVRERYALMATGRDTTTAQVRELDATITDLQRQKGALQAETSPLLPHLQEWKAALDDGSNPSRFMSDVARAAAEAKVVVATQNLSKITPDGTARGEFEEVDFSFEGEFPACLRYLSTLAQHYPAIRVSFASFRPEKDNTGVSLDVHFILHSIGAPAAAAADTKSP